MNIRSFAVVVGSVVALALAACNSSTSAGAGGNGGAGGGTGGSGGNGGSGGGACTDSCATAITDGSMVCSGANGESAYNDYVACASSMCMSECTNISSPDCGTCTQMSCKMQADACANN